MGNINEQIAKAEEEIRQLQNKKKKLLNQKKRGTQDKDAPPCGTWRNTGKPVRTA